jgi:hypothetical protein
VKLDSFRGLLKYNIILECVCEIGLFWRVIEVKYYCGVCVCVCVCMSVCVCV